MHKNSPVEKQHEGNVIVLYIVLISTDVFPHVAKRHMDKWGIMARDGTAVSGSDYF